MNLFAAMCTQTKFNESFSSLT